MWHIVQDTINFEKKTHRITQDLLQSMLIHVGSNCIPFYGEFSVQFDSGVRILLSWAVHKIWQWKHTTVFSANGMTRL